MDGGIARILDRLRDVLDGPGGVSLEQSKRNSLESMRSQWTRIEELLDKVLNRPPVELIWLQFETSLEASLETVNRAALHAETVLDELDEWHIIKEATANDQHQDQHEPVSSFLRLRCCCWRQPKETTELEVDQKEIIGELKGVLDEDFKKNKDHYANYVGRLGVVGREKDINALLPHLRSIENENRAKVICILGKEHTGKTTIAKQLYSLPEIVSDFSGTWASMPRDGVDKGKLHIGAIPVRNVADKKKFLLIIDGLEIVKDWEYYLTASGFINVGGVILVTTSNEAVPDVILSDHTHKLDHLSRVGCYEILTIVLKEKHNKESDSDSEFEFPDSVKKVLWEVAEKCQGLPESAENYGVILRDVSLEKLEQLSHDDIRLISWFKDLKPIQPLIEVYQELPLQQKRCISCCARFPKDSLINVDQLVALWMAKGYLHPLPSPSPAPQSSPPPSEDDQCRRKRGFEYFHDLAGKINNAPPSLPSPPSLVFFKDLFRSSVHKDKVTGCKMGDHFHPFAMYMAAHDVAWRGQNLLYDQLMTGNSTKVRDTCLVYSLSKSSPPPSLSDRWKYVRFLVLSACHLEQLPAEVQNMNLLQYLDLSGNPLKQLPVTACNWYSLQSLDVSFCYLLLQLPKWIGELQRLQHLRVNHTTNELHNLPKGFEKLTLIRTIDFICIGGDKYKSNVDKLRDLNSLEDLCIAVHGEADFSAADFKSKTAMVNLELCFTGEGRDKDKVSSIMRKFKPPPELEMLKLKDYPGRRLPRWIQAKSLVDNLKRLSLRTIVNITSLPTLWKLSSLEFLWLYGLLNIKHLGCEFFGLPKTHDDQEEDAGAVDNEETSDYSDEDVKFVVPPSTESAENTFCRLKTLRIEYLKNWETWEDSKEGEKLNINVMPCLEKLDIFDCPKLIGKLPFRILRDTPWFRDTYPNGIKEDEEANHARNAMKAVEVVKEDMANQERNTMEAVEAVEEPVKEYKVANERNTIKPPSQKKCSSRRNNIFEEYKKEENEGNTRKLPPSQKKCPSPEDNKTEEACGVPKEMKKAINEILVIVNKHPSHSTYEIRFGKEVLGEDFDLPFTRDELLEILRFDQINAPIVQLYQMYLHMVANLIKKDWIGFIDPNKIQLGYCTTTETRSAHITSRLMNTDKLMFIAPYFRDTHWMVIVIVLPSNTVYWFDPLHHDPRESLVKDIGNVLTNPLVTRHKEVHWKSLKHKKQLESWECGYYCMRFMEECIKRVVSTNLELQEYFPQDGSPYTLEQLKKIPETFARYMMARHQRSFINPILTPKGLETPKT